MNARTGNKNIGYRRMKDEALSSPKEGAKSAKKRRRLWLKRSN
jgi:hypothetical protein